MYAMDAGSLGQLGGRGRLQGVALDGSSDIEQPTRRIDALLAPADLTKRGKQLVNVLFERERGRRTCTERSSKAISQSLELGPIHEVRTAKQVRPLPQVRLLLWVNDD